MGNTSFQKSHGALIAQSCGYRAKERIQARVECLYSLTINELIDAPVQLCSGVIKPRLTGLGFFFLSLVQAGRGTDLRPH